MRNAPDNNAPTLTRCIAAVASPGTSRHARAARSSATLCNRCRCHMCASGCRRSLAEVVHTHRPSDTSMEESSSGPPAGIQTKRFRRNSGRPEPKPETPRATVSAVTSRVAADKESDRKPRQGEGVSASLADCFPHRPSAIPSQLSVLKSCAISRLRSSSDSRLSWAMPYSVLALSW